MARKTLIHKHTNLTTNNGGVLSPKLPTVGTLEKGEIAVNYKNGYETLSIENDANEVIPFGSLELTMAYTDAAILGNKPLVIEVNDTDTTVPSGTYASITAALAAGREVAVEVTITENVNETIYLHLTTADVNDTNSYYFSTVREVEWWYVSIHSNDNFHYHFGDISETFALQSHAHGNITRDGKLQVTDISIANGDKLVVTDSSNSNKIARASLSFDGSTTTKALTPKGTWETFLQTESDPTVPNWAKLLNKPTYTLDEINDGNTRKLSDYLTLSGGTMTGALTLNGAPSSNLHAATKKYVDDSINDAISAKYTKPSTGIPKLHLASSVQTSLSNADSAIQGVKVNGTALTPDSNKVVDITVPDNELSSAYQRSTLENEDLVLEAGDTYEEAFSKLEKAIIDDEETVAAALNELNDKIKDVDTELDEESENPVQNKAITLAILDNEYVVSVALNNLNDRIQAKLDILISGTNIKTINGTSILGSGNINVSGGSGTGGGGDENVIETIKVNGTALTPDTNKAVDISVPAAVTESTVSGWGFTKNSGTVTGVKMNGTTKNPTSGVVDLGTVLTSFTETDPTVPSHVKGITTTDISNWNGKQAAIADLSDIRSGAALGATALQSYTETDPTVPAWAKADNKPTYTAAEVGALPDTYTPPVTSVNGQTGAVSLTIPAAVTESTVSGWGFTKNTGTITGITMNGTSKGTSGVVNLGTVLTSHQTLKTINNESIVGSGNLTVSGLPTVSASDNGKILQVVNGAWSLIMPTAIYSGTSAPNNSVGNDGDLYLLTS